MIIASCWLALAIISSVYMLVFGRMLGDVMFGVFLPVGLVILVALIVTFGVASSAHLESEKPLEARSSSELQEIKSKLDALTREVEEIKKTKEE